MTAYYTFKGNADGDGSDIESSPIGGNGVISNIIITNTSAAILTLNVFIRSSGKSVRICPFNLQLGIGDCYTDKNLVILDRELIVVNVAGGSLDYYFSIMANGNNS